jgi:hypothetical protein
VSNKPLTIRISTTGAVNEGQLISDYEHWMRPSPFQPAGATELSPGR